MHQCPAVTDAARSVPGARIDWVVEEGFAGVARMHCSVERVIPVALRRWRGALWKRSVRSLARALSNQASSVRGSERFRFDARSNPAVQTATMSSGATLPGAAEPNGSAPVSAS